MRVCVCGGVCCVGALVPWWSCGGQRTTFRNWFLSTSLERTDRGTVVSLPEVEHVHSAVSHSREMEMVVLFLFLSSWHGRKGGL